MSVIRRVARLPVSAAGRMLRAGIRFASARDPVTLPAIEDLHLVLEPNPAAPGVLWETLCRLPVEGARHAAHSLRDPGTLAWEASSLARAEVVRMGEESGRAWERVLLHRRLGDRAFGAGCTPPRKISVLSAVREPVDEWISLLLHSARRYPELLDPASLTAEKVAEHLAGGESPFLYPWLEPGEWWEQDRWIQQELGERMRLDVFGTPFDAARGWQIYEGSDVRLLLIRHENLSALPEAVGTFYGLPSVPPVRDAAGSELRERYLHLRGRVRLPGALLNRVYSGRLVRQFYTPDEIRGFRERWSGHRP